MPAQELQENFEGVAAALDVLALSPACSHPIKPAGFDADARELSSHVAVQEMQNMELPHSACWLRSVDRSLKESTDITVCLGPMHRSIRLC